MEFGLFKREVYHKVLKQIFKSLEVPSQEGEAVQYGDNISRVFFPGICIQSLDGEEAWWFCATWGASADYPCPHCLVYKAELHKVLNSCSFWTVKDKHHAYKQAMVASTKASGEEIMKKNGLHKVQMHEYLISYIIFTKKFQECFLVSSKL